MRKYFYDKLLNLKKLTGLKQYEYFENSENPEKEINEWLDLMMLARDKFKLVSDDMVKTLIDNNILKQDIIGLYPKYIYQWLSAYWASLDVAKRQKIIQDYTNQNSGSLQQEDDEKPLTPEESQKYIDQLKAMADKVGKPKEKEGKNRDVKRVDWYEFQKMICPECEGLGCSHCGNSGYRKKTIIKEDKLKKE